MAFLGLATVKRGSIVRFVDGKAAEMWADFDSLVLYQQLGMELKPKEGEK